MLYSWQPTVLVAFSQHNWNCWSRLSSVKSTQIFFSWLASLFLCKYLFQSKHSALLIQNIYLFNLPETFIFNSNYVQQCPSSLSISTDSLNIFSTLPNFLVTDSNQDTPLWSLTLVFHFCNEPSITINRIWFLMIFLLIV